MIGIIVGHNLTQKGAYSKTLKSYEYDFFKEVSLRVAEKCNVDVYFRNNCGSYTKEMKSVIDEVNKSNYKLILELHFNSAESTSANGVECLYYKSNAKTKLLSDKIITRHAEKFGLRVRRAVPISNSNERGGYGIVKCKHPYILVESFFGSCPDDCDKIGNAERLAELFTELVNELLTGE